MYDQAYRGAQTHTASAPTPRQTLDMLHNEICAIGTRLQEMNALASNIGQEFDCIVPDPPREASPVSAGSISSQLRQSVGYVAHLVNELNDKLQAVASAIR